MDVVNNAAVARATTGHARLENRQLIRGHLVGTVSGDPDHGDGETIHTSDVLTVVKHRHIRTRNREYQLGSPDPTWARLLQLLRSSPDAALEIVALPNSIHAPAVRIR
ncbi:MAG: hypothetical protein JOZ22_19735 [Acidobacteriia bacterium]|nr:hypothetical protein [Terriglobia bacterium]MBV9082683.1 hypothetical protein [Acidobacteriaceae bacterium]